MKVINCKQIYDISARIFQQFLGSLLIQIREVYVFGPPFESYCNPVLDSSIQNLRSKQGSD